LDSALLENTLLDEALLDQAVLVGARVNAGTSLQRAKVSKMVIDRLTLDSLNNFGGLPKAEVYRMTVIDDVATLRSSFSGIMQWIHAIALILFLLPYVWFVAQQWAIAHWADSVPSPSIPLWEALLRYIVSGGHRWREGWNISTIPFAMFCLLLTYNLLRARLLVKTKSLEFEQEIRGLPSKFSFRSEPKWGCAYKLSKILFYVNVAAVIVHTIWFMQIRVPALP
jgi:hypothetical protein